MISVLLQVLSILRFDAVDLKEICLLEHSSDCTLTILLLFESLILLIEHNGYPKLSGESAPKDMVISGIPYSDFLGASGAIRLPVDDSLVSVLISSVLCRFKLLFD